tara:strand:- start:50 stop:694 length:645 start_codon:yes stop_codon:yes gene_type:complete
MSKESGIPTYRGKGGTWEEYNYKDYACESAFKKNPDHVLDFHELRRKEAKSCEPHVGHQVVSSVEKNHSDVTIVTQNIDGMHQRAGSNNVIELHGSLWRVRCGCSGTREDMGETYEYRKCPKCSNWLRPDIIWFEDMLDHEVYTKATDIISNSDLFISIGTSALVYPAAGLPMTAKMNGARCIEINIDQTEISTLYHDNLIGKAGDILPKLFPI